MSEKKKREGSRFRVNITRDDVGNWFFALSQWVSIVIWVLGSKDILTNPWYLDQTHESDNVVRVTVHEHYMFRVINVETATIAAWSDDYFVIDCGEENVIQQGIEANPPRIWEMDEYYETEGVIAEQDNCRLLEGRRVTVEAVNEGSTFAIVLNFEQPEFFTRVLAVLLFFFITALCWMLLLSLGLSIINPGRVRRR